MLGELEAQIIREEENNKIESNLNFKIILLGDSNVGKSSLLRRAIKGTFDSVNSPTIGYEFFSLNVKIEESIITLQIWDTCGLEIYRSLISAFYRNGSLVILVFSIDTKDSFDNIESWINEIKTKCSPDIIMFLIGNKADLEDKRVVTKEMVETFCENYKFSLCLETSAKTGVNAEKIFIEAAKMLYRKHFKIEPINNSLDEKKNFKLNDNDNDKEDKNQRSRKKKCC